MLYKIADLLTEIPEEGGIAPLLEEYKTNEVSPPDIIIRAEDYRYDRWPGLSRKEVVEIEARRQFHYALLAFGGINLHASAVAVDGVAYLFSAPSGTGKSTHAQLWRQILPHAYILNDDKPSLRRINGVWYAYGTPWSGKHHLNRNERLPLGGICFLQRGSENAIRRIGGMDAVSQFMRRTMHDLPLVEDIDRMLAAIEGLVTEIPIYELRALPDEAAARLSYETMRRGTEEPV